MSNQPPNRDVDSNNPYANNPFTSPQTSPSGPRFGVPIEQEMSQEAKSKFNSVRWTLLIIAGLTIAVNGYGFLNASTQAAEIARQEGGMVDENGLLQFLQVMYGCSVALGVVFVGLALMVMRFPLFCTATALILYGINLGVFGFLSPETLFRGIIFKVIIVVVLVQGIAAAINHRNSKTFY